MRAATAITRAAPMLAGSALFVAAASAFFITIGKPPVATLWSMVVFAVGDAYSFSETLVKTAPILLCALAVIVPARLGLISVGGEGQLYLGALAGTALVLGWPSGESWMLLPAMLAAAVLGGALWGAVAGVLRAGLGVHETITTLLLNYVAVLLVSHLVYGDWRDPVNLGWPATADFPPSAQVPSLFGTRAHVGLVFGLIAAVVLHVLLSRTRWGFSLRVLRGNARVAGFGGLRFGPRAIAVMAIGGGLAGLAGICEVSAIQGRLQPGISVGYGLTGFLVAWLSGQRPLRAVFISLGVGGLLAAGDALQLFAKIPAASAVILQGLLFVAALAVGRLGAGRG